MRLNCLVLCDRSMRVVQCSSHGSVLFRTIPYLSLFTHIYSWLLFLKCDTDIVVMVCSRVLSKVVL